MTMGEMKGRLGIRDDVFEHDNHVISVEGDGNYLKLNIIVNHSVTNHDSTPVI